MRILIVGAGVVGSNLAEELSDTGHAVSIVDHRPAVIRQLKERADVLAVRGNGTQPSVLRAAGIAEAEMVIAVTDVDEVNLAICMMADKLGVQTKIARLRNDEYVGPEALLVPSELGVDTVINPESIATNNLRRILSIPGSREAASFAEGQVLLVTFDVEEGAEVAGKRLAGLRTLTASRAFLVVAVFRGETAIVPRGDDEIRAGDHIAVLSRADTLHEILPLVQPVVRTTERVVIYGWTLIGAKLARALEQSVRRVVLIEPDRDEAQEAAAELAETTVLWGEARDPDVLNEADIASADYFIAVSADDESNLLAALMARRHGAARVAVLVQEPHYVPILDNIGMDVVLNPRLVTVSEILRYIRTGKVHTVTRLHSSEAEVMELEAMAGSKITRHPLKEIDFPGGSIIGAVLRGEQMVIPDGNCRIAAGERVIVFALAPAVKRIEKLFSRRGLL